MYFKKVIILVFVLVSSLLSDIKGPLEKIYEKKYENLNHFKAMYVAIDFDNGGWVYGYAYNHINEDEAEEAARKSCIRQKRKSDINGYCKLYATGDRVLGL